MNFSNEQPLQVFWMRRILLRTLMVLTILIGYNPVFSQTLSQILEAHYAAIGQDGRSSIRSLLMELKEVHSDGDFKEYSIIKKRPHRVRVEGTWQDSIYIKAFDGHRAWTVAPWTGTSLPQLMTETEKAEIVAIDRIDSPLYVGKVEDYPMELKKDVYLSGDSYYCIEVRPPNAPMMQYLLNKKDHLIYKSLRYNVENASILKEEIFYKRYMNQGSVIFPMEYEIRKKGVSIDLVVKQLVLGHGVSSALFRKPE